MPISATLISKAIKIQMIGVGFKGRDMGKIANSVGRAVFLHLSTPNITMSLLSGLVGPVSNVINTAVVGIIPIAMSSLMKAKGFQNGFRGRDLPKLARAISMGVSQVLMTMVQNGSSVGLALGTGTSKFVGLNPMLLSKIITINMISMGLRGRDMRKLSSMVATGVTTHLTTSAVFPVVATGVVAPIPPVGPLPAVGMPTVFSKIS